MKTSLRIIVASSLALFSRYLWSVALSAGASSVPKCIVSLSPTATETLFAIGAGKQVQAVDTTLTIPRQDCRRSASTRWSRASS